MSGDTYERELVNTLTTVGIPAMRAPSSGRGTERELPDVLAGVKRDEKTIEELLINNTKESVSDTAAQNASELLSPLTRVYGIESKSQEGTTLYVDDKEVEKLTTFCERFGATARLGARFTERRHPTQHFLVHPSNARMTDEGNYGLPIEDIKERASEIVYPNTNTQDPDMEFLDSSAPNL